MDVIKEIIGIKVFSYPSLFRGKFLKTWNFTFSTWKIGKSCT